MRKIFSNILFPITIGCMMLAMLAMPTVCINGATKGLLLWFNKLLPSLLPFIILMNMLCTSDVFFKFSNKLSFITYRLFGISGTGFMVFLLGLVGGYPMGAKLTKQLLSSGQISYSEAQKTLCFGTNCGPLFIIGTVGTTLLGNTHIGYFLLMIHLVSALLMLLLSRFYTSSPPTYRKQILPYKEPITLSKSLTQSVQNAMDTIVYVGGYIIFFSVIIEVLKASSLFNASLTTLASFLDLSPTLLSTLILSSLEFSNGSALIAQTLPLNLTSLSILSSVIAFGGFCVFFQCSYVLEGSNLKLHIYLISKIIQGIIAYNLTIILSSLSTFSCNASLSFYILPNIILLVTFITTTLIFHHFSKLT